jgi:hypothetical protein
MGDFIADYLSYTSQYTEEVPVLYSRWSSIIGLGALLGRQYYLPFGHEKINPNIYGMLIGSPGARKGTAIKLIAKLLRLAGFTKFAAERTSKEKFLVDLSAEAQANDPDAFLDQKLFGDNADRPDSEVFIAIDEFNDFIGLGNLEFISMLGNLWNFEGVYDSKTKTGKDVFVNNPTISIIGGNTPTSFKNAFPVDMIGQGFLSRLILIYGEPNGKRITIPPTPTASDTERLVETFRSIKSRVFGPAKLTPEANSLLDRIYKSNVGVDDFRFENYSTRRLNQLLKICLIVSASRDATTITHNDVIYANTILTHTEHFMPKALGEFGRARNSDVTHKVMEIIYAAPGLISAKEIWKHVHADLEDMRKLGEILMNLAEAEKIQAIPASNGRKGGYLPKRKILVDDMNWAVDWSLLTQEEREMKK